MRALSALACSAMLAAVLGAGPGAAEPVAEPTSGLAATPPPGYDGRLLAPSGRYAAMILVQKQHVRDAGCWIGFQPLAQNVVPQTQEALNKRAASAEWADRIRASLAERKKVLSLDPFEHAGVRGAAVVYEDAAPWTPRRPPPPTRRRPAARCAR
jgi:hypothetical protein